MRKPVKEFDEKQIWMKQTYKLWKISLKETAKKIDTSDKAYLKIKI